MPLVAADGVALRHDLDEGHTAVAHVYQVGEAIPHAAEVVAHRPNNLGQAVRAGAFDQGTQCAHLHVVPSEDSVGPAPSGGDAPHEDRKRISGPDRRELSVDL